MGMRLYTNCTSPDKNGVVTFEIFTSCVDHLSALLRLSLKLFFDLLTQQSGDLAINCISL